MDKFVLTRCPLCKSQAEFIAINRKKKHFRCPICTEFVMSQNAENDLSKRSLNVLKELSNGARSVTDSKSILVISWTASGQLNIPELKAESELRSSACDPEL